VRWLKIVARSKQQHPGKKRRSPETTAAPPGSGSAEASRTNSYSWTSGRAIWIAVSVAAATVVASIWDARDGPVAAFVGSETCAGCHQAEAKLWRGSHHGQAMDHATEKSVRGDFNDASFVNYGVRSRFFHKDGVSGRD
jgi:Cytochrome c554 and c-prime